MATYKHSSDYTLNELVIESNNGRKVVLNHLFDAFSIVEDIFTNYTYGNLALTDSIDLYQSLPILGGEKVSITYRTDGDRDFITREFVVYNVVSNPKAVDKFVSLTLSLVSIEAILDQNKLISKSFVNQKSSDIASIVFNELGSEKSIEVDETLHLQNMVIPNWTPFQCLNWLSTVSLPVDRKGSLFLLYEDKDQYNFKTLENIIDQEPVKELNDQNNRISRRDVGDNFNFSSISSFNPVSSTNDILKSMQEGMYASRVISYDNVSKQHRETSFDYYGEFADFTHLNKFELNGGKFEHTSSDQRLSYVTTKTYRQESAYFSDILGSDAFSQRIEDIMPYRSSQLSQLLAKMYRINISGDSDLTCGKVISLKLTTTTDNDELDSLNRYYTENVLITKCVHNFTLNSYEISLDVSSDTMSDDSTEKYKA